MIKNSVKFEHIIEGKVGQFFCDHDTPIAMAKEMVLQFLKYLGQIEDQIQMQQSQSKVQPIPEEQPKEAV